MRKKGYFWKMILEKQVLFEVIIFIQAVFASLFD